MRRRFFLWACFGILAGAVFAPLASAWPGPAGARGAQAEATAPAPRLPVAEVVAVLEPAGESNVRSSISLGSGVGLVGTEERGHIYRTDDAGLTWRKIFDGGAAWRIADARNFLRGADGHLYLTTSEPGLVARSADEGVSWEVLARPRASRTVGIVELDDGTMLVGLRRSENGRTSILRSTDRFATFAWLPVSTTAPRQNVTSFGYWGGDVVFAGVGFEGAGTVYRSPDRGLTWTPVAEFAEARDLIGLQRSGDTVRVFASGIATIYATRDEGATWFREHQLFPRGFIGQIVPFEWAGRSFLVMCATDQSAPVYRHLLLISDDAGASWHEWVNLSREAAGKVLNANESGGGASNLSVLSADTLVVGVGNHAVQGRAYTVRVRD